MMVLVMIMVNVTAKKMLKVTSVTLVLLLTTTSQLALDVLLEKFQMNKKQAARVRLQKFLVQVNVNLVLLSIYFFKAAQV